MSSPSISEPARKATALWGVLALLVISVSINYIDRGNLSIAAPLMKDEMEMSSAQLGILLSAFFWTYSTFQLVSGWLVDRWNANWILAAGFLLWSAATAATGFIRGFGLLIILRLLLGVGESVAYPSYSKILAGHFAEHQRGIANSLIDAGTKVGPALGSLAGGLLMVRFGWRPFFVVLGVGSLLWLPLWLKWMPAGSSAPSMQPDQRPRIGDILRRRAAWATFGGHFCGNYFWYFLLTWLPFYLVRERGFSMQQMGSLGSLAYFVTAAATTTAGLLSDRLIAAGAAPTRVRKACTGFGLGFATIIVGVTVLPNRTASIILLLLACMSYGVFASSHWAITQTFAGPLAAGKWSGLQNFVANLSGVAAPAITGLVVGATGHFLWAFAVSAGVSLSGAMIYTFLLGPVEPVDWQAHGEWLNLRTTSQPT
jgi:ACS family D-galactonate transporter-like MFS transporter